MDFNMNRTWAQGIALMRANFQLLAIIAGVFLLLPGMVVYMAMPDMFAGLGMSEDPEQLSAAMAEMAGPVAFYALIAFVLQMIGYVAMIALMGDDRPTVGEAIKRGVKSLPTIIGATLLFILIYLLLAFVLGLILVLIAGALGAVAGEGVAAAASFVLSLALVLAIVYVATRLSLTLPVIVLEGQLNPAKAMIRSWRLTASHAWAIVGFYVLLVVAYVVISLLLFGVFGVVGAALGEGAASALFMGLVNGLIGAAVAMIFSGILVSMHQQLAGRSSAEISETFE